MIVRRSSASPRLVCLVGVFLLVATHRPASAGLLPAHAHLQTVINGTGQTADGFSFDLLNNAFGFDPKNGNVTTIQLPGVTNFASPAFAGGSVNGKNQAAPVNPLGSKTPYIWGGKPGNVPNGGSTTVAWFSAVATDVLLPTSYWTSPAGPPGTNIGAVTLLNPVAFDLQENGDGSVTVLAINAGPAVAYTDLSVVNGAPFHLYDAANFVPGMALGSPVSTLIPPSGILPSGTTILATFIPSATGYSAESITIDGAIVALGQLEESAIPTPEPSGLVLALIGLGGLAARCRPWRDWRRGPNTIRPIKAPARKPAAASSRRA